MIGNPQADSESNMFGQAAWPILQGHSTSAGRSFLHFCDQCDPAFAWVGCRRAGQRCES